MSGEDTMACLAGHQLSAGLPEEARNTTLPRWRTSSWPV